MTKLFKSDFDNDSIKRIYLKGGAPWGFRIQKDHVSNDLKVSQVISYLFKLFHL